MWTVTGRSRWKNSWAAKRQKSPLLSLARYARHRCVHPWVSSPTQCSHRSPRPCLNPGPCSRRRLSAGDGLSNNATPWVDNNSPMLGANRSNRGGFSRNSRAGFSPLPCTTCLQPSPLACVVRGAASASTVSGASVRCAGRGIPPCRTDHSSTKAPFSSRSSSSNQTDGACMTPERVKPTRFVPPPAVLSPNMK